MTRHATGGLMLLPPRPALIAVTGNALVMGVAGVGAPVGWVLLPVAVATSARPRVAAVVSIWSGLLVIASVLLPIVPGHRADVESLAASAVCLALLPAVAWLRERRYLSRSVARLRSTSPGLKSITLPSGVRRVALAVSDQPDEVTTFVELPDGTVRVLLGVAAGQVSEPRHLSCQVEQAFEGLASQTATDLSAVAAALDPLVRRLAPQGHLAASLVQISDSGQVHVQRCGGPEILAIRRDAAPDTPDRCIVVDRGPGHPPLGLGTPSPRPARSLPDDARIAIVTTAYSLAHYADYTTAVHEALRSKSIELASLRLLLSPATPTTWSSAVGPALVIESVRRAADTVQG